MNRRNTPPTCAQCGAEIPPNARACPECGADERTGWDESSLYDGLDLPEDDLEGASARWERKQKPSVSSLWRIIGMLLFLAVLALLVFVRR